jgi:hypothetical protein
LPSCHRHSRTSINCIHNANGLLLIPRVCLCSYIIRSYVIQSPAAVIWRCCLWRTLLLWQRAIGTLLVVGVGCFAPFGCCAPMVRLLQPQQWMSWCGGWHNQTIHSVLNFIGPHVVIVMICVCACVLAANALWRAISAGMFGVTGCGAYCRLCVLSTRRHSL